MKINGSVRSRSHGDIEKEIYKMKNVYISPEVEVISVAIADILTESAIITDEIPLT